MLKLGAITFPSPTLYKEYVVEYNRVRQVAAVLLAGNVVVGFELWHSFNVCWQ
jgi:hypothetical protein